MEQRVTAVAAAAGVARTRAGEELTAAIAEISAKIYGTYDPVIDTSTPEKVAKLKENLRDYGGRMQYLQRGHTADEKESIWLQYYILDSNGWDNMLNSVDRDSRGKKDLSLNDQGWKGFEGWIIGVGNGSVDLMLKRVLARCGRACMLPENAARDDMWQQWTAGLGWGGIPGGFMCKVEPSHYTLQKRDRDERLQDFMANPRFFNIVQVQRIIQLVTDKDSLSVFTDKVGSLITLQLSRVIPTVNSFLSHGCHALLQNSQKTDVVLSFFSALGDYIDSQSDRDTVREMVRSGAEAPSEAGDKASVSGQKAGDDKKKKGLLKNSKASWVMATRVTRRCRRVKSQMRRRRRGNAKKRQYNRL